MTADELIACGDCGALTEVRDAADHAGWHRRLEERLALLESLTGANL